MIDAALDHYDLLLHQARKRPILDPMREPEDLVQDVYLHLLERGETLNFNDEGHAKASLTISLNRRAMSANRTPAKHRVNMDEHPSGGTDPNDRLGTSPDIANEAIARLELRPILEDAATDFRATCVVLAGAGWTHQELADSIGSSRQTITSAVWRYHHRRKPARRTRPYNHRKEGDTE